MYKGSRLLSPQSLHCASVIINSPSLLQLCLNNFRFSFQQNFGVEISQLVVCCFVWNSKGHLRVSDDQKYGVCQLLSEHLCSRPIFDKDRWQADQLKNSYLNMLQVRKLGFAKNITRFCSSKYYLTSRGNETSANLISNKEKLF